MSKTDETDKSAIDFSRYESQIKKFDPYVYEGKVNKVVGLTVEGKGPPVSIGNLCKVYIKGSREAKELEVIGFRGENVIFMPFDDIKGISSGCRIVSQNKTPTVEVGTGLLGRVVDGMGNLIDGKDDFTVEAEYPVYNLPVGPLERKSITKPIDLGIKAINGLLSCGMGQRIGIFAGTGVGKSKLMGMMSSYTDADVSVIALIGERGREVKEFIEKSLGKRGLKNSIIVAATSDKPPLVRMRGAFTATSIAEYFRDKGLNVLLLMDSVTRFALAQREVGLAAGEPPTTKGYTPSVFALLPQLLERAGTTSHTGSITGVYTVLVEGDDLNEPVSDSVRSIIDGHIVLSRELAARGHYPAIDILNSISRVMIDVVSKEHLECSRKFFEVLATYKSAEDLINIGAYVKTSNPKIDYALSKIDALNSFLKQDINESVSFDKSYAQLKALF